MAISQIKTQSITPGSTITGNLIGTGAINASNTIQAGSITGNLIGAGAISTNLFASSSITGNLIASNSIRSNNIVSEQITGNLLGSASVSGNNIGLTAVGSNNMTTTGVTAANYGGSSNVATVTVDSAGRITYAANVSITSSPITTMNVLTTGTSQTWTIPTGITKVRVR